MTTPANVVGHTSGLCPVCHQPYSSDPETLTDVAAVDHLAAHGPRAVAFALLVADGHRLLAQGAHDAVTMRARQLTAHLDVLAREQRAPVTGGDGW
jgi:hypothetical protein